MSEAYFVRVTSGTAKQHVDTLHVIADGPDEAAAAVRKAVRPDAVVEAEREPISTEQAREANPISGKILLG